MKTTPASTKGSGQEVFQTCWLSGDLAETWRYHDKKRLSFIEPGNRGVPTFCFRDSPSGLMRARPQDSLTMWERLEDQVAEKSRWTPDIVMDSSGLKIFGESEWKVCSHGKSKRRTWRKLHVGVDPHSGEIQAAALTTNNASDSQMVTSLLAQIEQPIRHFAGDGSYDQRNVYDSLNQRAPDAVILIPPRKNARIWQHGNTTAERIRRDENLRAIRKSGRKAWKQESGYHMRSLASTTMFRLKTIFGDRLSARLLETQITQSLIRCAALYRMTHLGKPDRYKVA